MPRRLFVFDEPDRISAGAIGDPGARTFYLQVREGSAVVSVSLEKAQVAALANHLEEVLDALDVASDGELASDDEPFAADDGPLENPPGELFRVGAIALAWDSGAGRLVIEAQPLSDDAAYRDLPDDDPDGPDVMRVRIAPSRARSFARHAARAVAAGRPTCPYCGMPLEPTGHFCPRNNGHLN